MGLLMEEILIYAIVFVFCGFIIFMYLRKNKKVSKKTEVKVAKAKEEGLFEPISLHPFIDLNTCIGSAACISACPEKDILGIVDGKATVINTTNCIGHGACFHDCPVEAISLRIGTEKRGVELPHVNENFETNIKGIFIAGELGGMGLIKNSVEQGKQAVDSIIKRKSNSKEILDLVIVGAGPAGISASLAAKKNNLKAVTLEQDSLGGTVYTFPRSKVVMTSPMYLPLEGKVKLYNTSKDDLLDLWNEVISKNNLEIYEKTKVENIMPMENGNFKVVTSGGNIYLTHSVLLAIGRRGSPRKLNVPGEESQKVAYRLLEPERILNKKIVIVGGGDSAIESAILLKDQNDVILSYRKDKFSRLKPKNKESILNAQSDHTINIIFNSNITQINESHISIQTFDQKIEQIENDLVFIFAGGELPTAFLQSSGVGISKRFGYIVKKHP